MSDGENDAKIGIWYAYCLQCGPLHDGEPDLYENAIKNINTHKLFHKTHNVNVRLTS